MPIERELDGLIREADKAENKANTHLRQRDLLIKQIQEVDRRVEPQFNMLALVYSNQPGVLCAYVGNIGIRNDRITLGKILQGPQTAVEFEGNTYVRANQEGVLPISIEERIRIPSTSIPEEERAFGLVFRPSFAPLIGVCPPSILGETPETPAVFLKTDMPSEEITNAYKLASKYGNRCFQYHTKHLLTKELRQLTIYELD